MDEPWAWWRSLGSPATVCAPMVDQSERAFRLLVRRHGCDLCYTPMLHADLVVRDAAYRRDHVPDDACAEDRPLIAQLGGGDPATLAAAAREIAARGGCDAIDVNLGCPQACARRGGYGAFLDDDGAARAVRAVAEASPLPATAKIRCRAAGDAEGLDVDVAATVALAERLVAAGAAAVCVHARTRAGKTFAEACWPAVRAVVAAVGAAVPVVANGGVPRVPRARGGRARLVGARARRRHAPRRAGARRRPARGGRGRADRGRARGGPAGRRRPAAGARPRRAGRAGLRGAPGAGPGRAPPGEGRGHARERAGRAAAPRAAAAVGEAAPRRRGREPAALRLRRAGEARLRPVVLPGVLRRGERRRRLREPRVAEEAAEVTGLFSCEHWVRP